MGGICTTSVKEEDKAHSKDVDRALRLLHNDFQKVYKILLLGAGESGKSTFLKQLKTLYATGFSKAERDDYVNIVSRSVIECMKVLTIKNKILAGKGTVELCKLTDQIKKIEELSNKSPVPVVNSSIAETITQLWTDEAIRNTWKERSKFQLDDSADYLFNKIDEISKDDYVPSDMDIFKCRVRTTGITEFEFSFDRMPFTVLDVGGQRNERKKWIHCFEGVTAVIFFVAMQEFDQFLYEDEKQNRMDEALQLFHNTVNSPWFKDSGMILFLNKIDLFEEKIAKKDITCLFDDYKDGCDSEKAREFIKEKFISQCEDPNYNIYPHYTCCTDSQVVKKVSSTVIQHIVQLSFKRSGLT